MAQAVKEQLGRPEAAAQIIRTAIEYRDEIKKGAAPKGSAIDGELRAVETKIGNLVDALAGGMNSEAVTAKLAELDARKAQLAASKRMLEAAEDQVGLTDQQIQEAAQKMAAANLDSPAGLRTLLSVVLRVNVYADHIEVFTIFGGDGNPSKTKSDLQAAAREFITTIDAAPPAYKKAPPKRIPLGRGLFA